MRLKIIFFILIFALFQTFAQHTYAQESSPLFFEEKFEATVVRVIEEKKIPVFDKKQYVQKLDLLITTGPNKGQNIILEHGILPSVQQIKYQVGDKIVVNSSKNLDGNKIYIISDYVRRDSLLWLFGIFVGLVTLVSGIKGIKSLFGLLISFGVIFTIILPSLLKGNDPVTTTILACLIIVPTTFYLSHGFNKKTSAAIVSTLIALFITGVLASLFVELAKLSGYAAEEASFLQFAKEGTLNIKGLLLSGIIIGVLGILDDITISQAAIVHELKKASPGLDFKELYTKAMNIGKDHIASVVNTLVIVYTGASLPLLMLFIATPNSYLQILNQEIIAEEVVRTLIASIGLILAVPLSTLFAALTVSKKS